MLPTDLLESLTQAVGLEAVSTAEDHREIYSTDALTPTRAFRAAPSLERTVDAVVAPRSTRQVADVVRLASRYRVPLVPYGGGTGVMGAAVPVEGGIALDLKGLDRIVEISPTDRTVTAEAGVVLGDLASGLEERGLMLGHDPWSLPIATVGGAISTNSVGYRAASYGSMGAQVLGLEVVMPDGEVLRTRSVPLYSSGPNLNHLFIGSEGTFGVITKATLRVFRAPEVRAFATVGFESFDDGFEAVAEMFSLGLIPTLVDLSEEYTGTADSQEAGQVRLYLMFEGYQEGVEAGRRRSLQVCDAFRGTDLGPGATLEYWNERHHYGEMYRREMLGRTRSVRWQKRGRSFDYLHLALPISRVLDYRRRADELLAKRGLKVVEYAIWTQPELFSMLLVPDGEGPPEDDLAAAVDEVLALGQDMGGTMEYCHGVGLKLAHLLPRDMGAGYEVARAIKRALDPYNIMNPGKLF